MGSGTDPESAGVNVHRIFSISAICLCVIMLMHESALPEVYKWTDDKGRIRYSSEPPAGASTPARLPEITRAPVKMPEKTGSTCTLHGGINCAAGPDNDGSVVCFDGFRDAVSRFNFSCREARLQIAEIREKEGGGECTVFVRNQSGVDAMSPVLFHSRSRRETREFRGPERIAAYGVEEIVIPLKPFEPRPDEQSLRITCTNCP